MKQQLSSLSLGKNNRDRWLWRWSLLSAAILCWLASGPDAPGGKCKISGGKLDLNVLFLYNETDLTGWKPVFTEASKLIYNATDGHLQFGKVNFYVACQPAKDAADIWISTGTGGASSHVNGCGNSGWHVFLSNIHKRNDASAWSMSWATTSSACAMSTAAV